MAPSIIPARHGIAIRLSAGQTLKVINTYGTQVVDTWAFTLSLPDGFPSGAPSREVGTQLSMQHTRASLNRTIPKVGDGLYNNERKKLLTLTEDTCGVHDTLIAACDRWRYIELGSGEGHRNCEDNLGESLEVIGIKPPQFAPQPLNLFMNIPIHEDRTSLSFEAPSGKKGEYVCLRAEEDLVVAMSACPQDILKINGGSPTDAHYEIL